MNHSESKNKFLHDYGCNGYKIIAAYEEACNIQHNDRFADWFGDLGVFEASLNENVNYKSLFDRYNKGLKYLGLINEQADIICSEFSSTALAEHIKEEKINAFNDKNYGIKSILSKRDIFEFDDNVLSVDNDIQVETGTGNEITASFECWFDVEKKLALRLPDDDDIWVDMYGKYNPFDDKLKIECVINKQKGSIYFDYTPTDNEDRCIKNLITKTIREEYNQTPQEFCEGFYSTDDIRKEHSSEITEQTMGGM